MHDEALARVRAEDGEDAGLVTVAASTIAAEYLLPRVIAELRRRHPRISVRVWASDSRRAVAAMLAQECDFAVVGTTVRDRRTASTVVADDQVVLVGLEGIAPRRRLAARDLAGVPLVLRQPGSGTRDAVDGLLRRASPFEGRPFLEVGSTEAVRRCVLAGLGLGFISRRAVEDDLERKSLVRIELAGTPVRRQFLATRLRHHTAPPAARHLWELLVQQRKSR
jgi:DNA-binding transcriptional LysR family regulator